VLINFSGVNSCFFCFRKVVLPTTDGIIFQEEDNLTSRSVTRLGYTISVPSMIKAGLHGEEADMFVVSLLITEQTSLALFEK